MSAMQIWLGGPREVARNGIPCLGPRWDYTEDKYFSLIERDRAVELACQFGLANEVVLATSTKDVTIVDPSALSSDFVKEETYRLAVLALHIADDLANEVAGSSHSNVTVREALAARLGEIGNPEARLKALVHPGAAQDEAMQDAVTKELLATFERAGEIVNGGTMRRVAALRDGIEFLDARRDAMPISLMTTPNSPSPH